MMIMWKSGQIQSKIDTELVRQCDTVLIRPTTLFLQPLDIATERHPAVAILRQIQWLIGSAFLDTFDIEQKVIVRSLMNRHRPDFMEHIDEFVAGAHGEGMFDTGRHVPILTLQVDHFAEFDATEPLRLIPEIHFLPVEARLRPGEEQRMLMSMIGRKIAADLLPRRSVNRMYISAPAVVLLNALWHRLFGFDVFQHGFIAEGHADHIVRFRELQISAEDRLDHTGDQKGKKVE